MAQPRLTGGEQLLQQNIQLASDNQDLLQRNIALLTDRDDLVRSNTRLETRIEGLLNEVDRLTQTNEHLILVNDALKIVLADCEDERNHYKNLNIRNFNIYIENFIFGLFNQIQTTNHIIDQIIHILFDNTFTRLLYHRVFKRIFIITYSCCTDLRRFRIIELVVINAILIIFFLYFIHYILNYNVFVVILKES
jgi:hypothetical protein